MIAKDNGRNFLGHMRSVNDARIPQNLPAYLGDTKIYINEIQKDVTFDGFRFLELKAILGQCFLP